MGSKRKHSSKEGLNNDASSPSKKRTKTSEAKASTGSTTNKTKALDKAPFSERPSVQDRKRELELYEQLGSEVESDRIAAGDVIITALLSGPQSVLERHLGKRLFRGLTSGRNASRLGFSIVITEILRQLFGDSDLAGEKYPDLTFDKLLGMLVEHTVTGGGSTGQEERDRYFGQLFGIYCFVRSGVLFSDKRRWLSVLDMLIGLSQKKSWLRSSCGHEIVQAIPQMGKKLAERTLEKLASEGFAQTPEGIAIWIVARDQFPDIKVSNAPWKDPLSATSLSSLPAVLKESGREPSNEADSGSKIKHGGFSARPHFVWDIIAAHYLKLAGNGPDTAEQFKQFWKKVVDEGFFSKTSSDIQKFSGLMIFQKMMEDLASSDALVSALFTQNFMGCLMNQAAREDRYLHRAALKALKGIESAVEKEPHLLPTVLKWLLGKQGAYNFDERTNTKTVEKLLQNTKSSTSAPVLSLLQQKPPSESGLDDGKYYQALGGYLACLIKLSAGTNDDSPPDSWVPGMALGRLSKLAYSSKSVPAKIKESLQARCTASFAKLAKEPKHFPFLCNVVLSVDATRRADDEAASEALSVARDSLKGLVGDSLGKKGGAATDAAPQQWALALLYAAGILQIHNGDPDAVDLLDELDGFYKKLTEEGADGEGLSEFLVEILLAMVARPSSFMRQVSQQVFEAFTGMMSHVALSLLTDPLLADESAKGQQALFSTEDEDMADADAADADDDEEELDSDVEIVDLEDAGSEEADDNESSEEEKEEDEVAEKDQEALDALDNALAEVLRSHRLDKDAEAESEDGSDMTDSEMMAVEEKLAEIFRQRKTASNKKDRKTAKETVVNFKHRVLDLLSIYIRKEAALLNPLAFEVLLPLLGLARTTTTKALANKACEMIINFQKALKKARSSTVEDEESDREDVDADKLMELLETIHAEASKDPSHAFAKAVSTASLAVASVLYGIEEMRPRVFQLYAQTQLAYCEGKVKIQHSFFVDWLNWCQGRASAAATQS
ncbi:DNA polymerase V [Echria macrotheca]|uniref:DNA polymerase V n=1 Tax=Echria macrotheca TaxID=438768 RepID=A0AAJ0BL93_9PEZI|nr:DNA polymerase V [Echria macrotheca]